MVMFLGSKTEENGPIKEPKPCPGYKVKSKEERNQSIDDLMEELKAARDYTMSMRRDMDDEYRWCDWGY